MVERCSELHDAWQAGARAAKSHPSQPAKCVDGFARGPGLVDVLSRPCELLTRLGVVHAGAHAKAATVCEQALVHVHVPLGDGCDEPCWQLQKCSSAAMRRPCRSGWQDAHGIVILHWHFWQDLQCQVLQSAQCPHFRQKQPAVFGLGDVHHAPPAEGKETSLAHVEAAVRAERLDQAAIVVAG